jgi:hypothetical protein
MKIAIRTMTFSMLGLLLLSRTGYAQQAAAASTSTVSGHVICSDTNRPARFGKVLLKSTQGGGFGDDFTKRLQAMAAKESAKGGKDAPKPPTDEDKRTMAMAARTMNRATDMLNASTIGLDGAYSFAHVKPGTYYVHVLFPGYVDPLEQFSDDDLASTDPAMIAKIKASVTMVTVSGTDSARADLRLERGASVSGRVLFDDGSPAVGWIVTVVDAKAPAEAESAQSAAMTQALMQSGAIVAGKTDDLGQYRVAGLARGEYVVQASFHATGVGVSATNMGEGGSGIGLEVYSNGTFNRADAKGFTVSAGENRAGVDVTVPFHKLHNVTGHVYAKTDEHPVNSGQVTITGKANTGVSAKASILADGSFHYDYLPPGTYTVKVDNAADARTTGTTNLMGMSIPKQEILRKYATDQTEVVLSDADVDTVKLTVAQTDWTPPVKKPGKEVDPGAALGGLLGGLLGGDDSDDTPAKK